MVVLEVRDQFRTIRVRPLNDRTTAQSTYAYELVILTCVRVHMHLGIYGPTTYVVTGGNYVFRRTVLWRDNVACTPFFHCVSFS